MMPTNVQPVVHDPTHFAVVTGAKIPEGVYVIVFATIDGTPVDHIHAIAYYDRARTCVFDELTQKVAFGIGDYTRADARFVKQGDIIVCSGDQRGHTFRIHRFSALDQFNLKLEVSNLPPLIHPEPPAIPQRDRKSEASRNKPGRRKQNARYAAQARARNNRQQRRG